MTKIIDFKNIKFGAMAAVTGGIAATAVPIISEYVLYEFRNERELRIARVTEFEAQSRILITQAMLLNEAVISQTDIDDAKLAFLRSIVGQHELVNSFLDDVGPLSRHAAKKYQKQLVELRMILPDATHVLNFKPVLVSTQKVLLAQQELTKLLASEKS